MTDNSEPADMGRRLPTSHGRERMTPSCALNFRVPLSLKVECHRILADDGLSGRDAVGVR